MGKPREAWAELVEGRSATPAAPKSGKPGKADQRQGESDLEAALAYGLRLFGQDLPAPRREYRAVPMRDWRFDFAWPEQRLVVEVQGGIWARKKLGHATGAGLLRDYDKANAATALGWRVLFLAPNHLTENALERTVELVRLSLRAVRYAAPMGAGS